MIEKENAVEQEIKAQHILTEKKFSVSSQFELIKQHLQKVLKRQNPKGKNFDKVFEKLKVELEEKIEKQDNRLLNSLVLEKQSDLFTFIYIKSKGISRIVAKDCYDELASLFAVRTDGEIINFQFKDCYLLCFCENNLIE